MKKRPNVQRKKSWEIVKASKRAKDIKGIIAGGKKMEFGSSDAMITHDEGIAREVTEKYEKSGDVVVVEIDDMDPSAEDRGGKRFRKVFVINAPWKK